MIIDYSPYTLKSAIEGSDRQGALIRVTFPNKTRGYADLHPWVEFGDEPLEKQLERLKTKQFSYLTRQTMWMAARDADARKNKKNLLDADISLKNNFLIGSTADFDMAKFDDVKKRGFTTVKIKVGWDTDRDLNFIKKLSATQQFQMRLDFNMKSNFNNFKKFIESLGKRERDLIQYVEDPFPYNADQWKEARQFVKVAADFAAEFFTWTPVLTPQCDVIILKPARRDIEKAMDCLKTWQMMFTVTSNLDHVIGSMHAFFVAQYMRKALPKQMLDPGCFTFLHYKMDAYSAALVTKGPYVVSTAGTGVGFDLLLDKEKWKSLE